MDIQTITDKLQKIDDKTDQLLEGMCRLEGKYQYDHERIIINEEVTKTHSKKIYWTEGAIKLVVILAGSSAVGMFIGKLFVR